MLYNLDENQSSKDSINLIRGYIITEWHFLYISKIVSRTLCVKTRCTIKGATDFVWAILSFTLRKIQDTYFYLPTRHQSAAQRSGNTWSHSECPWNTGSVTAQPRKKSRSAMKHAVCAKAERDCEHRITMARLVLLSQQKSLHHSLSFLDLHADSNRSSKEVMKWLCYHAPRSVSCNIYLKRKHFSWWVTFLH